MPVLTRCRGPAKTKPLRLTGILKTLQPICTMLGKRQRHFVFASSLSVLPASGERLCNGTVSVRLSRRSTCSWFAAARAWAADIDRLLPAPHTGYRSISAGGKAQLWAASCCDPRKEGRRRLFTNKDDFSSLPGFDGATTFKKSSLCILADL